MSTGQNYDAQGAPATPIEPAATNPAQPPVLPDKRLNPIFDQYSQFLSPDYLAHFEDIQTDEYPRTGLLRVSDESLAPQLRPGTTVMGVLIDPIHYDTVTGIIAITTRDKPGEVIWGRVERITPDLLQLGQQAPNYDFAFQLNRSAITSLVDVRYIVHADQL